MADHAVDVPNGLETDDVQVAVVKKVTNGLGNHDESGKHVHREINGWGEDGEANKWIKKGTDESEKHDRTDEAVQEKTGRLANYNEPDKAVEQVSNVFVKYNGVNEVTECENLLVEVKEAAASVTGEKNVFVKEEFEEETETVQHEINGIEKYDKPVKPVQEETDINTMIDFTKEEIHIKKIELGSFEIDTTYPAAYPDQLNKHSYVNGHLFACEYCLLFTDSLDNLNRHKMECNWTQPCGIEVYNKGDMSVFEIDGTREKAYCECLCLISKLFLDNKRKQCNVEQFVFYALTINDMTGKHLAGYFSKEKAPNGNNNVSCLLILPHYQRQGLGRFLIDLSYLFSRIVKVPGTPERPLSSLGMISYQSYWKNIIAEFLYNHITEKSILIKTISEKTGIDPYDIALTLQTMNLVKHHKTKVSIVVKQRVLAQYMEAVKAKNHIILDEECLQWTPWVQENTKETEKSSRLLRGNAVHKFTIVKNEESYFSHSESNDVKPPPCKIAK